MLCVDDTLVTRLAACSRCSVSSWGAGMKNEWKKGEGFGARRGRNPSPLLHSSLDPPHSHACDLIPLLLLPTN